jgi:phosphate starvation-inducible PhoH-like protein
MFGYILMMSLLLTIECRRSMVQKVKYNGKYEEIQPHNKIQETYQEKSKIRPRNNKQELYVKYLNDPSVKIVVSEGSAGCGKTLFACDAAIKQLYNGNNFVDKIVLTRPIVSVENENLGFLPGDMKTKMNPWLLPIFDIFLEYFTQKEIDKMVGDGIIEISPLGFLRGRTFKNCFIIADEIQNATPSQVLMLSTRLGENSKLVLTGDLDQSDLYRSNGLEDFTNKLKIFEKKNDLIHDIKVVEFDSSHVERSEIVKNVLRIYS